MWTWREEKGDKSTAGEENDRAKNNDPDGRSELGLRQTLEKLRNHASGPPRLIYPNPRRIQRPTAASTDAFRQKLIASARDARIDGQTRHR